MDAVDHKNAEDRATGGQSRNEADDPNQKKNDPEDQSDGLINILHGFLASFHFEHTDRKEFWITSPEFSRLAARLWPKKPDWKILRRRIHPNLLEIRILVGRPGSQGTY